MEIRRRVIAGMEADMISTTEDTVEVIGGGTVVTAAS
jgi:hypothetical protein